MKILLKIEDTINRQLTGYLLTKMNDKLDLNILTFDKDTKDESIIIIDLKNRNVFSEKDVITFIKYTQKVFIDNNLLTLDEINSIILQYEEKKNKEEEKRKRLEKFNQLTEYLRSEGYFELYNEFKKGINPSGLTIDMDIPNQKENIQEKERDIPNQQKDIHEKEKEKRKTSPFQNTVRDILTKEFGIKEDDLRNIEIVNLKDLKNIFKNQ